MFGKPKRNQRCQRCTQRGQCSCNRRDNAVAKKNPAAAPRPCTRVCRPGKGACGATARGGVCPCSYC